MNMDTQNHFITLFMISNSFNGFGFGLFLFAFGVGSGVVVGMVQGYAICIAIGAAIMALSVVGCVGAITQDQKKLNSYAWGIAMLTAAAIVHLLVLAPNGRAVDILLRAYFVTMVFIISVSIVSMLLAWTMSYRIGHARAMSSFIEKNAQQNLQA
ncbi:uncharacterized protein LOC125235321 [Leguminivora glycinivorella]|uniref:uncharacterized protein LOC125235321 n=1 Tax=Leguminivora glycinivorella TaxID=1035111 RepID=UPI00200F3171|nr:uncharacterized protein LOC125235321 [Leguminivora glycinivorella]